VPKDALKLRASRRTRKMSRVIRGLEKLFSPMSSGEDKECEMPDRIAQNSRTISSPGRRNFDADVSTSPVESSVVWGNTVQYPCWLWTRSIAEPARWVHLIFKLDYENYDLVQFEWCVLWWFRRILVGLRNVGVVVSLLTGGCFKRHFFEQLTNQKSRITRQQKVIGFPPQVKTAGPPGRGSSQVT